MNPIKEKIIDLCLDEKLEGKALVKALEQQIALILPFDHSNDSDFRACGLDSETIALKIEKKAGSMSNMVESIENAGSKRVLAIAVFTHLVEKGEIGHPKMGSITGSTASEALGKLQDLVGSLFGDEVPENVQKKIDKLKKDMTDLDDGDKVPDSPKRCREEDNSECYKCPHNSICTKFK